MIGFMEMIISFKLIEVEGLCFYYLKGIEWSCLLELLFMRLCKVL